MDDNLRPARALDGMPRDPDNLRYRNHQSTAQKVEYMCNVAALHNGKLREVSGHWQRVGGPVPLRNTGWHHSQYSDLMRAPISIGSAARGCFRFGNLSTRSAMNTRLMKRSKCFKSCSARGNCGCAEGQWRPGDWTEAYLYGGQTKLSPKHRGDFKNHDPAKVRCSNHVVQVAGEDVSMEMGLNGRCMGPSIA